MAMFSVNFRGDAKRCLAALGRHLLYCEIALDGTFLFANDNYCAALERDFASVQGQHVSAFVSPAVANSPQYKEFLAKLARGESFSQELRRVDKNGHEKWLMGYYEPVVGPTGALSKIVAIGFDNTAGKAHALADQLTLAAISRAQAVAEYSPDGKILAANENFLNAMGYQIEEIQGQSHSMFVDPAYARSAEHHEFWRRLTRGEFIAEEFRRFGKGGKEVWLQATYNPIFDLEKRVVKVVEIASDVTGRVTAVRDIAAGLARLADGDLAQRFTTAYIPTLEPLRLDFNASLDALERTMAAIALASQAICTGSGEIAESVDALSRRTERQASSLESSPLGWSKSPRR